MKKGWICILVMSLFKLFSEDYAFGYIINKDGDTVKAQFVVPEKFDFVSYKELQNGIFIIDNGKKRLVGFDVKFIHFNYKEESFNYIPVMARSNFAKVNNKYLFMKLYQNGRAKVVEYFFGNSFVGMSTNCSNDHALSKSIYLILTPDNFLVAFHQGFRSGVDLLFVNCVIGSKEVKKQMLDCLDVPNIATIYNNSCY